MLLPNRFSPTFFAGVDGNVGHLLCHPFEQMAQNRWHQVSGTGNWDTEGLRRDHLAELFHSKSSIAADPDAESEAGAETFSFKISDEVFVSINTRVSNQGRLDIWAVTPELARQHFLSLREVWPGAEEAVAEQSYCADDESATWPGADGTDLRPEESPRGRSRYSLALRSTWRGRGSRR